MLRSKIIIGTSHQETVSLLHKFVSAACSVQYCREHTSILQYVHPCAIPFDTREPILTEKGESLALWAYLALAVVVYFRWTFLVIDRFCGYLDIYCLTIKKKAKNN